MFMQNAPPLGIAKSVLLDRSTSEQYDRLVTEELDHYDEVAVTEGLTEGGVHAHKSWSFYFGYLNSKHFGTSFHEAVCAALKGRESPRVLSLGCGYGGHDLDIAQNVENLDELIAVDLNPRVYDAASRRAAELGLPIVFQSLDLNRISIQPGYFDVIYAVASIHHILNLEHLMTQIHHGLKDDGRLIVVDIIGKNQVEFWRENVEYAAKVVKRLAFRHGLASGRRPLRRLLFDPYTVISPYVEPESQTGMEGIRQEEIAPLLDRWFRPEKVFYYDAFMRLICTNPTIGPQLDPDVSKYRRILESLIEEETEAIASGKLRPTEVFGIYAKKAG
jgi:SAM-dependent methyltransferase